MPEARIRTQDAATDWSMVGKTVLFTGASRGMGRFAALELASLGAEVLVVGHNQARGAAAVEAIRRPGGTAQFLRADMGDADQVCALAAAVLARSGPGCARRPGPPPRGWRARVPRSAPSRVRPR